MLLLPDATSPLTLTKLSTSLLDFEKALGTIFNLPFESNTRKTLKSALPY
jgi:hypothetical protein